MLAAAATGGTLAAMNIAVVVAGGLTDALQAAPLLRAVGTAEHRVSLLGPPGVQALSGALPGVAEVLALPALSVRPRATGGALLELRRRRLDAVLLCSERPRDRLLVYGAGIARRAGSGRGGLALLLTDRLPAGEAENRAAMWLGLARGLGGPVDPAAAVLDPGQQARRRAEEVLVGGGFEDGRLLVGVAPGSAAVGAATGLPADRLCWDPERFAHLGNQLSRRHGAGIVLLGGGSDRPRIDRMLLDAAAPILDLAGQLSLVEMAAVAERCDLVVAADSPILHLAAAVGTPTVGLFGPTEGRRRGPFGADHRIVQGVPDGDPPGAMARIRVDDVLAGIESRFDRAAAYRT